MQVNVNTKIDINNYKIDEYSIKFIKDSVSDTIKNLPKLWIELQANDNIKEYSLQDSMSNEFQELQTEVQNIAGQLFNWVYEDNSEQEKKITNSNVKGSLNIISTSESKYIEEYKNVLLKLKQSAQKIQNQQSEIEKTIKNIQNEFDAKGPEEKLQYAHSKNSLLKQHFQEYVNNHIQWLSNLKEQIFWINALETLKPLEENSTLQLHSTRFLDIDIEFYKTLAKNQEKQSTPQSSLGFDLYKTVSETATTIVNNTYETFDKTLDKAADGIESVTKQTESTIVTATKVATETIEFLYNDGGKALAPAVSQNEIVNSVTNQTESNYKSEKPENSENTASQISLGSDLSKNETVEKTSKSITETLENLPVAQGQTTAHEINEKDAQKESTLETQYPIAESKKNEKDEQKESNLETQLPITEPKQNEKDEQTQSTQIKPVIKSEKPTKEAENSAGGSLISWVSDAMDAFLRPDAEDPNTMPAPEQQEKQSSTPSSFGSNLYDAFNETFDSAAKVINKSLENIDNAADQYQTPENVKVTQSTPIANSDQSSENSENTAASNSQGWFSLFSDAMDGFLSPKAEDLNIMPSLPSLPSLNGIYGSMTNAFSGLVENVTGSAQEKQRFIELLTKLKKQTDKLEERDLIILQNQIQKHISIKNSLSLPHGLEEFQNDLKKFIVEHPTISRNTVEAIAFTAGFALGGPAAGFAVKTAVGQTMKGVITSETLDIRAAKIAGGVAQALGAYVTNGLPGAIVSAGTSLFQDKAPPVVQAAAVAGSVGFAATMCGISLPLSLSLSLGSWVAFNNTGLFKSIYSDFKYAWKTIKNEPLKIVPRFCTFIKNQVVNSTWGVVRAIKEGKKIEAITRIAAYAIGILAAVYSLWTLPLTLILFYMINKTFGPNYDGPADLNNPSFRQYVLKEYNSKEVKNVEALKEILMKENSEFEEFCIQLNQSLIEECKTE